MSKSLSARPPFSKTPVLWTLAAILLFGLLLRLLLLGNQGFTTDISTFEFWAISLAEHGFGPFYSNAGFADYPPGYFYVLAVIGHVWEVFFKSTDGGHYSVLKVLVKLPAILADLGVGVLSYAIVRRFASPGWALFAAALYLLNPAIIYNSAAWGQVDSVAVGFALLAIYFLLRSGDDRTNQISWYVVFAWVAIAYSLLIKPQAAIVLPIMLAFSFVDSSRRRSRLLSTSIGILIGLLLAVALTEPFHWSNPLEAVAWLFSRYEYGSNVYPYNSVNAFNLWAIRGPLWQADTTPITIFGGISLGPQYLWGLLLLIAALGLVLWRFVQMKSARALLESCAIAAMAFFVLSTRMHERYSFDALAFTIICAPLATRYVWGAVGLTVVLFANLRYSLEYLNAMQNHTAGVDVQNLWGIGTTVFALLAVAIFFWLGYQFLGGEVSSSPRAREVSEGKEQDYTYPGTGRGRSWFNPCEGLTSLRYPLDYLVMGALGLLSFILSFIGYWYPPGKVFDEIYFARAGEEYLQNLRIYENTHPPLSKLMVTFSMVLFGGMPRGHGLGGWTLLNGVLGHLNSGDNSYGWRFLDVVFGALVVVLLYAFAKRITGSMVFAGIAALLLVCDGMHFVQSRIATPEGFVVFFATLATYAFYRFWLASQVADRRYVPSPSWAFVFAAAAALLVGLVVAFVGRFFLAFDNASTVLLTLYASCPVYLLIRLISFERFFGAGREQTFAEGTYALTDAHRTTLYTPDGGTIDDSGKVARGVRSINRAGALTYDDAELRIAYRRDMSVEYGTPDGAATYISDEIHSRAGREAGRSSNLWLILFTVALGLLVSSKWYGVMGFGVSFLVLIGITIQGYVWKGRPLLWGNPRGFRIDAALTTIVLISATVYALVWVPDLARQSADPNEVHTLNDVVYRQYSMFEYHDVGVRNATHPYSSKWWEWPLDMVPVAYYYSDERRDQSDPRACCVYEITSMPNPMILWFGLLSVPWVGLLAWRERNKGYALIVLTYLLQWLPWMLSPRITFAYHFYVDIPLICLCNAILLQRIWLWGTRRHEVNDRWLAGAAISAYVLVAILGFSYFYPILSAHGISWDQWHQRMWIGKWIIGPG